MVLLLHHKLLLKIDFDVLSPEVVDLFQHLVVHIHALQHLLLFFFLQRPSLMDLFHLLCELAALGDLRFRNAFKFLVHRLLKEFGFAFVLFLDFLLFLEAKAILL